MGLGKLVVMGLIGFSTICQIAYTGYFAAGGKSKKEGASAVVVSFIGACVDALCFLALYFNW